MNAVDQVLRTTLVPAPPTEGELERIDARYREVIGSRAAPRKGWLRPVTITVAAAVLLAVVVVIQATRPDPVSAALDEIAHVAEQIDPSTLGTGEYYYTESTVTNLAVSPVPGSDQKIAYLIPQTRRVWVSSGGEFVLETTNNDPTFIDPALKDLYYAKGLDEVDKIGETTVVAQESGHPALTRDWPADPKALDEAIRGESFAETDAGVVEFALGLIEESPAPPQLRAAVIRVLSDLDVRIIARTESTTTFETVPSGADVDIYRFQLRYDGQLLRLQVVTIDGFPELGIAPGFVVSDSAYSPTTLVEEVTAHSTAP